MLLEDTEDTKRLKVVIKCGHNLPTNAERFLKMPSFE